MYNYMSIVLWFKLGGGSTVKSPWHNVMYVNPIHTIYGMYKNTKTHVLAMRHRMYILIMDVITSRLRHMTDYTSSGFSLSHYLLLLINWSLWKGEQLLQLMILSIIYSDPVTRKSYIINNNWQRKRRWFSPKKR